MRLSGRLHSAVAYVVTIGGCAFAQPRSVTSPEEARRRSVELLRKMTIDEKAGQLNQARRYRNAGLNIERPGRSDPQTPGRFGPVAERHPRNQPAPTYSRGRIAAAHS